MGAGRDVVEAGKVWWQRRCAQGSVFDGRAKVMHEDAIGSVDKK